MNEAVRINRYLALCGVCSRREADRLIGEGRVLIDGVPASAGDRVEPGTPVTVDGKPIEEQEQTVLFAYYKPRGVVCTERDPHADRTVARAIDGRRELAAAGVKNLRLTYIGRLDKDSEGLLLLTNDGKLKQRLESAESGAEKEYLVTTDRPLDKEARKRLEAGVYLEELDLTTRPCRILPGDDDRQTRFILTEGKNRQIRRMCETQGVHVERLVRIRECGITLDDLRPGDLRQVSPDLVDTAHKSDYN